MSADLSPFIVLVLNAVDLLKQVRHAVDKLFLFETAESVRSVTKLVNHRVRHV